MSSKKYSEDSFINIPEEFHQWSEQIESNKPCNLLIVIGPPKIGKTSYFRSLGDKCYYSCGYIPTITEYIKKSHNYVVLDEIYWKRSLKNSKWRKTLEKYKPLFLGEGYSAVNRNVIKHTGKPCVIITSPSYKNHLEEIFDQPEYQNRVIWVNLTKPLYPNPYQENNIHLPKPLKRK